jgi:hypothetical protein
MPPTTNFQQASSDPPSAPPATPSGKIAVMAFVKIAGKSTTAKFSFD